MLANRHNIIHSDSHTASGMPTLPASILTIRYADREDLAKVLDMYLAALSEIKDYVLKPSVARCAREVLVSWAGAPCILLEKAGEIIGFAGFKRTIPAYSEQEALTDYTIYVHPTHRGLKAFSVLSEAAKAMADTLNLPLFLTHMTFDNDLALKRKLFDRMGYRPVAMVATYGGK